MASNLDATCNFLLKSIRSSGLNFSFQETPFSMYVTIRKSFIQSKSTKSSSPDEKPVQHNDSVESELDKIKAKYDKLLNEQKSLQKANENIKSDFEEAINECEANNEVIGNLQKLNADQSEIIGNLKYKISNLQVEKTNLETKNKNVSVENKAFRKELKDLKNETTLRTEDLKFLKKENKDIENNYDKKIEELECTIGSLQKFKAEKIAEEKGETDRIEKKLKIIEKKEADLEIERINLETKANKMNVDNESKESQTDQHPDLPYEITSPLPPIFNSQLCHATPPIHFLSRSMPRLDKICWSKPNDCFVDEAEEFLNFQYDQQVQQYYLDAKQEAMDKRMGDMMDKTTAQ